MRGEKGTCSARAARAAATARHLLGEALAGPAGRAAALERDLAAELGVRVQVLSARRDAVEGGGS